jgi:hypothetical protein
MITNYKKWGNHGLSRQARLDMLVIKKTGKIRVKFGSNPGKILQRFLLSFVFYYFRGKM